jgi:hypothetical protein
MIFPSAEIAAEAAKLAEQFRAKLQLDAHPIDREVSVRKTIAIVRQNLRTGRDTALRNMMAHDDALVIAFAIAIRAVANESITTPPPVAGLGTL